MNYVIWFTGLSGSGKSTIAEKLYHFLKDKGEKVEYLDGDIIRDTFPKTGFDKNSRVEHIKRIGFIASLLEKHGITVICSFISPYKNSRDYVRKICKNYKEIYISTPIEHCEKRDIKGLYKKARNKEIKNFTGISDPYQKPENPELTIDTSKESVEVSLGKVIKFLKL